MSVLLTETARDILKENEFRSKISLEQLLSRIESLDSTNLENNPSIRKVTGTKEDIYVMRVYGVRAFITKNGKDIVLLSVENG